MSNLTNELSRVLDQAGDDLGRDAVGVELAEKVHGPITELVLAHDVVVDGKSLFVEAEEKRVARIAYRRQVRRFMLES